MQEPFYSVDPPEMDLEELAFEIDDGVGFKAVLGLIVLSSDQTIEYEARKLLGIDGYSLYQARIPNDPEVTPETLGRMDADIPVATRLLPEAFGFDVIGYGCTSGAMVIGEERVSAQVKSVLPNVKVTDPVTAARAALHAMGVKRVALLTPYIRSINVSLRENLLKRGLDIPVMGSFNQVDDLTVARIDAKSILDAIAEIGASELCDGVFVSCTSLRVADIVEKAERKISKPVTSSNHALLWHMLRLAGNTDELDGKGQLFRTQICTSAS